MNWEVMVFVLLAAGLLLIFAELFVPSGGIIAILCVACLAGSAYAAWKVWYGIHPGYWWGYVAAVTFLIPATLVGAFQLLTRTAMGDKVLLSAPTAEEVTPYRAEEERLARLIGERGTALNLMTPGGLVSVNGERLHAISAGLMIESGTPIEIVSVRGTRVIVKPATDSVAATPEPLFDREQDGAANPVDPWEEDRPV